MDKKFLINLAVAGVLVSAPLYPIDLVKCPDTLSLWLRFTVAYISENTSNEEADYWKTPKETLKDKGGDCEDLSFLTKAILEDMGYEAKVLWLYGRKSEVKKGKIQDVSYSHAICIFKTKDGKYQHMNNLYFISKKFDTIEQIVAYCCKRWTWWREIELPDKKYKYNVRRKRKHD